MDEMDGETGAPLPPIFFAVKLLKRAIRLLISRITDKYPADRPDNLRETLARPHPSLLPRGEGAALRSRIALMIVSPGFPLSQRSAARSR